MCVKQVISLVETMKLRIFPDLFVWSMQRLVLQLTFFLDDLQVSRPPLFDKKKL